MSYLVTLSLFFYRYRYTSISLVVLFDLEVHVICQNTYLGTYLHPIKNVGRFEHALDSQ